MRRRRISESENENENESEKRESGAAGESLSPSSEELQLERSAAYIDESRGNRTLSYLGAIVAQHPVCQYDPIENVLSMRHPQPVDLATKADILAYFDHSYRFWERHCGRRKVYALVDYANLTMNLAEIEFYSTQVKRVLDCSITIVRYDGGLVQRIAGRMTAIRLHIPSNTYATRQEALEVVQGLKSGAIELRAMTR